MTQEESIKLLALIKLAYPNSYKDIDRDTQLATVNMWQRAFADIPLGILEMALDNFVKVSKFPPTIADIIERLRLMNGEATLCVLTLDEGKERDAYKYIVNATAQYSGRSESVIQHSRIENLLKGNSQPLLGG